jgi:phosphatidylglycerophosphate synthase
MKSDNPAGARVRQAVIVCAPERGDPLRVVGGLTLIERLLRQLGGIGVSSVVVVAPEEAALPPASSHVTANVRTIHSRQNEPWQMAAEAAPFVAARCVVIAADVVVDQRVLSWLGEQTDNVVVAPRDHTEVLAALDRAALEAARTGDVPASARVTLDAFPTYWASMRGDVPVHVLRVASDADAERAWRVLIDHVDKRAKDLPALLFDPPFENALVRWLAPTRVTPNQITVLTTVLGFLVAWLLWQGWLAIGVVLAIGVEVLDGVDGKLARLKRMTSRFGEFEHVLDFFYEMSWYLALGHTLSGSAPWAWPAAALICISDLADNLAYIHHRRTAGGNLDEASPRLLRFRLVAGRRNIYMWFMLTGVVCAAPRVSFALAAGWALVTAAVHWQQSLARARVRPPKAAPSEPAGAAAATQTRRAQG